MWPSACWRAALRSLGVDNLNAYYDPRLKRARLARLREPRSFEFQLLDLAGRARRGALFDSRRFDCVVHLAAQAGVRYSIDHPHAFAESNITGFLTCWKARGTGVCRT